MGVVENAIVLPDPTIGRTSKQSSSVSLGKALNEAIEIHNARINGEKQETIRLEILEKPRAYSQKVMVTVERKICRSKLFKKYYGKVSYQTIMKETPRTQFMEEVDRIISAVNEEHRLLAYTEGSWGARKALVTKLRIAAATNKNAGKERKSKTRPTVQQKNRTKEKPNDINNATEEDMETSSDEDEVRPVIKGGRRSRIQPTVVRSKLSAEPRKRKAGDSFEGVEVTTKKPKILKQRRSLLLRKNTPMNSLVGNGQKNAALNMKDKGTMKTGHGNARGRVTHSKTVRNATDVGHSPSSSPESDNVTAGIDSTPTRVCVIDGCVFNSPPTHRCKICEKPMHNLCGQRVLGKDAIDGLFFCSISCIVQSVRNSNE